MILTIYAQHTPYMYIYIVPSRYMYVDKDIRAIQHI